jgi:4-amino-4-deoxy-L-arabinose transferase-like glycosyltransferase
MIAAVKVLSPLSWERVLLGLHCILSFACAGLVYSIAERVSRSRRAAVFAVALYVTHILLQVEFVSTRETALYVFLELLFFYTWCASERSARSFLCLGMLAGLSHLTRPNGIFLIIVLVTVAMYTHRTLTLARQSNLLIAAGIGFCSVILPWQLQLYSLTGQWSLSPSVSNGLNIWKGNNRYTPHVLPWLEIDKLDPIAKALVPDGDLTTIASNDTLGDMSWSHIQANPLRSLGLALKKGAMFLARRYLSLSAPGRFGKPIVISSSKISNHARAG